MTRRLAQRGLVAASVIGFVVVGSLLLARQPAGRIFPAGEDVAGWGIRTYRITAGSDENQRHVGADLLDINSESIGRIEMLTTRGTERATIHWKGESITLVVHKDRHFELQHEGRTVTIGEGNENPEAQEFFRLHAERVDVLRVAGRALWKLATSLHDARAAKNCGQGPVKGDPVTVQSCTGGWTWDCSWGVRVFRSWACDDAMAETGEECTNGVCWGCCSFGDCNCACMAGDFNCFCCVDGRACYPSID